jgi:hypothetical protein
MDVVTNDEPTYSLRRLTLGTTAVIVALAISSTWVGGHESPPPPQLSSPSPTAVVPGAAPPTSPDQRHAAALTAPAPAPNCFATADSAEHLVRASGPVPVCVLQWRSELRHQRLLERQRSHRCYSTADTAAHWIEHTGRLPGCPSSRLPE